MVSYEKTISNDFILLTYDVSVKHTALRTKIRKIITRNFGGIFHNESVYLVPNKHGTLEIIKSWANKDGITLNIWTSQLFANPQKLNEIRGVFKSEMKERLKEVKETIKKIQNDIMERLPKDENFKGYINRIRSGEAGLQIAKDIARRYGDEDDQLEIEAISLLLQKVKDQLDRAKNQRMKQIERGENL